MADNSRLEIPEGTVLQMGEDGLVLGHQGDVVIRSDLGHRLKRVYSETGSVELAAAGELQVDVVEAKQGRIVISGTVQAKSITAQEINLQKGSLSARSVVGETRIALQSGELAVDLLMSPEVQITPEVKGRATVIESRNELGPHQLKGAFRMAEFMELVPSAQKVIQMEANRLPMLASSGRENGAAAAETAPPEPPAMDAEFTDMGPEHEAAPEPPSPPAPAAPEPLDPPQPPAPAAGEDIWDNVDRVVAEEPPAPAPPTPAPPEPDPLGDPIAAPESAPVDLGAPEPPPAPMTPPPVAEPTEAPVAPAAPVPTPPEPLAAPASPEEPPMPAAPATVPGEPPTGEKTIDDEPTVAEDAEPPKPQAPPFHGKLVESIDRIHQIYTQWPDGDVPPAVGRLREMAESGLYSELKVQLTSLWRQILAYHSKTGTKIPSLQVQQMFRAIQRTLAEHVS